MKRRLQLITILLFAGHSIIAQDLALKIPEKATAVASIKSDQLQQLFSIREFNSSPLGQRLLGELSKKANGDYKGIEDVGFNLSSTIYYYHQTTDSISYHCLLIPLSDARKFETLLNDTSRANIKQQGDIRTLQTRDNKSLLAWNKETLFISYASISTYFFTDSLTASRYGIKDITEDSYYDEATTAYADADTTTYVEEAEPTVDTTAYSDVVIDMPSEEDTATYNEEGLTDIPPPVIDNEYTRAVKQQDNLRDSISASWTLTYAMDVLSKNNPSILSNTDYVRSQDKNAIGSFWMANLHNLYAGYMPYSFMKYGNMLKGYGSFNARLYMDKEHMRITGEMALDEDKANAYRKMYDKKLNKKFLKYIKSDSLIGFMSYAFDTEAYLNQLPAIFSHTYGRFDEEIALGGDLLSLMLDEKAIAKVVKGDALMVMTNLSPKESTYTTYVYDENYERKDTVQTKTETLPDLLFMFSSDDTRLIEKLLKYGVKKEKVTFANNVYSLYHSGKNPFNLHMLLKDGIVFMGTSLTDVEQINAGTFQGNISKQQQELLLNNNMTMFFSPKNLHNKMPASELGESFNKILNNSGNVYMKSSGVKGNYVSAELIADVPKDQENALKYFLSMFNDFTKK